MKIVKRDADIIDVMPHHPPLLARVISRRVSSERTAAAVSPREYRESTTVQKGPMDVVMFKLKLVLLILVGLIALGTTVDRPDKADAPQAPCKQ